MIAELDELSQAVVDAVNYRVRELGEPLEDAVAAVEASLRERGIDVALCLSTASRPRKLEGDNVVVYEVRA